MSRFRSINLDSDPVDYEVTKDWYTETCAGMTVTSQSNLTDGTYVRKARTRTMTDIVTPRFREKVAQGVIINSPMTQTDDIVLDDLASYYRWNGITKLDCSPQRSIIQHAMRVEGSAPTSYFMGAWGVSHTAALEYDSQSLIDRAVAKAWSNASLDEVQALVIAAEAEKSVLSMQDILRRLIKILRAIKKGDGSYLASQLTFKELADRYMEVRYAIRPMLYDFAGVRNAIHLSMKDTHTRQTFRGHTSDYDYSSSTSDEFDCQGWSDGGTWIIKSTLLRTASVKIDVRAGVLASLEADSKLPVWGLHHPVEAMWELVPYSFVIDWIFNISDVLSAWSPEVGIRPLASWYVSTIEAVETTEFVDTRLWTNAADPIEDYQTVLNNGCYTTISVVKQRVPDPSRPVLPSFNLRLNTLKLIDLAVMAKNIFSH